MARWMHPLAVVLGAFLLICAPAQSALAQPAPRADAKNGAPSYPTLEKVNLVHLLTFCSQSDKDGAIAEIEAEIAKAEANIKALDTYYDALAAKGSGITGEQAKHMRDAGMGLPAADLKILQGQLARAKSRKVVDCKTPRSVLPPLPKAARVEWTAQKGICDPKAAAQYIADLRAAYHTELANFAAINTYLDDLKTLRDAAAAKGSRFAKFKPEIDQAIADGERGRAEALANFGAISDELLRAEREEPIKCPEPRAAPQPAGPGAPGDEPKTPPRPKPKPVFPLPGPDVPPVTPQPPADGPKAAPVPAPGGGGGGGAFHLPWTPQRPAYQNVDVPGIPEFCDEQARNTYLTDTLTPAIEAANHNVELSDHYLTWLNEQFALANKEGWPTGDLIAIKGEITAVNDTVARQQAFAAVLQARYQAALKQPLSPDCPKPRTAPLPLPPPPPPGDEPKPKPPGEKTGCDCLDRAPISVGPNNRVGSGARNRDKAVSTAVGLVGGLLGGGHGGGGGGGGSDGPQLVACRISDKEMSVFDDPATGVSLKVGAKRSGDRVVVFADIAKSPDDGTFQAAWLQDGSGAREAPRDVGICGLWGEWQLTVSWTRTTYVNDQVVSRESGGWSKSGAFHIPGTLSSAAAPDGLWKRLGFSNASHGARKIALTYDAPKAKLADGPLAVVIHVTRPGRDPVTTAPFALMLRETPTGFVIERPPTCLCDSATRAGFSDVPVEETEVAPVDYRSGSEDAARRKVPGLPKTAPTPAEPPKTVSRPEEPRAVNKPAELPNAVSKPDAVKEAADGPRETDAETDARRKKADAAEDKRQAENAPKRAAFDKKVDEIAKASGPAGGADKIKPTASLDDDGVPLYGTIDYYRKDFPLPIYETTVDSEGRVTGGGYTNAYGAYMTMKAAVKGEPMRVDNTYRNGPDGRPYIEHAKVSDLDGNLRGEFTFGPDGNARIGAIFDAGGHQVGVLNNP